MSKSRIASIDILRGIVMVIMALDHVRDFWHQQMSMDGQELGGDPTNMASTTPILFFTRFITHFCAPTFVFLTGTSAYLIGLRKSRKELSLFLIKRGLWLILVELLVITLAITFNPLYNILILQVIWVIGWSMVILGLMVWLPYEVILVTGLVIMFGHNALDLIGVSDSVKNSPLGMIFYYSYNVVIPLSADRMIFVLYSLLPWLGVMLTGYGLGKLFTPTVTPERRVKMLWMLGLGSLAFFVVMRFINGYGDQNPWAVQPRGTVYTILSFFNITKYPASLLYYACTLGVAMVALAMLEHTQNRFTKVMNVFGRVPFFYYVIHFFAIHFITVIIFFIQGYGAKDIVSPNNPFLFRPFTLGFPLWGVYVGWILLIIALYPLCKKYDRYKSTHKHWWLSYL